MEPNSFNNDVRQSIETPLTDPKELTKSLKQLTLDKASSTALPNSPKTSSPASELKNSLKRLTINAAPSTALQKSPNTSSPARPRHLSSASPTPGSQAQAPRIPLSRSPSSMSVDVRSTTPSLRRKASMNTLHGVGSNTPSRSPSRAATPSRRSSSASYSNGSTMAGKSPLSGIEDIAEAPRHTAESIASNHFKTELELHGKDEEFKGDKNTDTIVVLHDACYGHRFSRPHKQRNELNTIVERPERISACILGTAMAYVRLGERHSEGRHSLHPAKGATDVPAAPFRIHKTNRRLDLMSQAVTNVHGLKWMEELKVMCESAGANLAKPELGKGPELTRPRMDRSGDEEPTHFHAGDLYLCEESLNAMEGALGAVCEGIDAVFNDSDTGGPHRSFVVIRPPGHHCSADYPSGFCWLNNVHVGVSHAALTHGLTHAAIIDFDLHHGDGSQAIAYAHNTRALKERKNGPAWKKTSIGYFSIHDINSYPCEDGDEEKVKNASLCIDNSHGQSIWNVHLEDFNSEAEFWDLYATKYSIILEKTRKYLRAQTNRLRSVKDGPKPKAAIFISAGFDASEWELSGMQRHSVKVPTGFYARLTRDIVKLAAEPGSGVDGRVISVLEGGYSDRALYTGVFSHLSGLAGGDSVVIQKEVEHNGVGYEMGQKINKFNGGGISETQPVATGISYDPSWWSLPHLEQLEATMRSGPSEPSPKKLKEGPPPTYSSPTTSFMGKVVSPEARRNVLLRGNSSSPRPVARPQTPPPPEVDWAVATHELSKLLIPSTDRQTESYKFEELHAQAKASKIRKDRESILPNIVTSDGSLEQVGPRMGLRVRKPVKPLVESEDETPTTKATSKTGRRRTVAGGTSVVAQPPSRSSTPKPEPSYTQATKQSSRRLSTASATGAVASEASERLNGNSKVSSATSSIQQRPSTSASVRPESSFGSRGQSGPAADLKKARAPTQSREAPPKIRRPRRKSPLNETTEPVQATASSSMNKNNLAAPPRKKVVADVDALTAGMGDLNMAKTTRKIPKGSLTTQATRDEPKKIIIKIKKPIAPRQEKLNNDDSAASSSTLTTDNPAATDISAQIQEPVLAGDTSSSKELPHSESLARVATLTQNVARTEGLPIEEFPESPIRNRSTVPAMLRLESPSPSHGESEVGSPRRKDYGLFIPYVPEGAPATKFVEPQDPISWLPPNTATPVDSKKFEREREQLPVWSSTGKIPFGIVPEIESKIGTANIPFGSSPKTESASGGASGGAVKNVIQKLDAIQKLTSDHTGSVTQNSDTKQNDDAVQEVDVTPKVDDASIWEISDTPER